LIGSEFHVTVGDRTYGSETLLEFSSNRSFRRGSFFLGVPQPFTLMLYCSPDFVCGFAVALAAPMIEDILARKHLIQIGIALLPNGFSGFLSKLAQLDFSAIIQPEIDHARF
jgi:hypothetical protein